MVDSKLYIVKFRHIALQLLLVIFISIMISFITMKRFESSIEKQTVLNMQNSAEERLLSLENSYNTANRECFDISQNPIAVKLLTTLNRISDDESPLQQDLQKSMIDLESFIGNYLKRIINDSSLYENIFFLDTEGNFIIDGHEENYDVTDFTSMDFYTKSLKGEQLIQDVIESPFSKEPIMIIGNPVLDSNDNIIGVCGAVILFNELTNKAVKRNNNSNYDYGIVDSSGILIAHSNKDIILQVFLPYESQSLNEAFKKMTQEHNGYSFYEFDGYDKVMAYSLYEEKKWHMVCTARTEVYMEPINSIKQMVYTILVIILLIAGMVIWRTSQLRLTNKKLSSALKELQDTQQQLILSEKMAALGGLVAGIAHEVNTPIGVGVTAVSYLKQKTEDFNILYNSNQLKKSDLEKFMNTSTEATHMIFTNLQRASNLIQSFKKIAVDQTSEDKRIFNVKEYMNEIILSLKPALKKTNHKISIKCDNSLSINSYPGALSQIISNFILNSIIHAYDEGECGNIYICFESHDNMISFKYSDDGKGINKKNLNKIFDPYFTTKMGTGGSGLGLNIVYNIVVKELKGAITCKSEVGRGTEFTIIFTNEMEIIDNA